VEEGQRRLPGVHARERHPRRRGQRRQAHRRRRGAEDERPGEQLRLELLLLAEVQPRPGVGVVAVVQQVVRQAVRLEPADPGEPTSKAGKPPLSGLVARV
jgi:hypothetical protein